MPYAFKDDARTRRAGRKTTARRSAHTRRQSRGGGGTSKVFNEMSAQLKGEEHHKDNITVVTAADTTVYDHARVQWVVDASACLRVTFPEAEQSIELIKNSVLYHDKNSIQLGVNSLSQMAKRMLASIFKGGQIVHMTAKSTEAGANIHIAPPRILGDIHLYTIKNQTLMVSQRYYVASSANVKTDVFSGNLLKQFTLFSGTSYFAMRAKVHDEQGVVALATTGRLVCVEVVDDKPIKVNNDALVGWAGPGLRIKTALAVGGPGNVVKRGVKSALSGEGFMLVVSGTGTVFLEGRRNPFRAIRENASARQTEHGVQMLDVTADFVRAVS
jgi:uncharacterized protein (AIM24 family)